MTDYILSKIKGKVLLLSVSVDNFGLISATFHVNGKEAVSVSGVTLEELNASFDTYMGKETFEAAKPAKVVVKEKKLQIMQYLNIITISMNFQLK